MEDLGALEQMISAIRPVSEEEWSAFSAIWHPFSAKRKETLTATGEKEKYLYFVTEGVQRVYYFDDQDREATLVFTYAPSFGGVLDSFLLQHISRYSYETLTPSHFYRASFTDYQKVLREHPSLQEIITTGLSQTVSGLLERLVELQSFSSEEKFRTLLKRSPHILQLVPHKYLANYLGIDPTNFSKFINKVKI